MCLSVCLKGQGVTERCGGLYCIFFSGFDCRLPHKDKTSEACHSSQGGQATHCLYLSCFVTWLRKSNSGKAEVVSSETAKTGELRKERVCTCVYEVLQVVGVSGLGALKSRESPPFRYTLSMSLK